MNSWENDKPSASSELDQNILILRQIDFFSGFSLEVIKLLAYLCTRETFQPGDHLFEQGDDDGTAFYIIDGETSLMLNDNNAGETPLRSYSTGDFIGSLSLLGSMPRLFSLKAAAETTCLVLTRDKFTRATEQFPDLGAKVTEAIVKGVLKWESRYLNCAFTKTGECRYSVGVSLV